MERASKLAIVLAAVGLLAADLAIGRAWHGTFWTCTLLFIAAALAAAYSRRAVALVLAFGCVFPVLLKLTLGLYQQQLDVLWMAPLLGAMMPDACSTGWHLPRRWRAPLLMATLAVALGTPIVVLREIDFNPALLTPDPEAVLSGLPPYFAEWSILVGFTLIVGVLWFDWLLGARDLDLERTVLPAFGLGVALMAAAAVYQLFVDISFLNDTAYAPLRRATGTMLDGNLCGTLAAVGLAGAIPMFTRSRRAMRWGSAVFAVALLITVWASGSRTALAATLIVLVLNGGTWWREQRRLGRAPRASRVIAVGGAVLVGLALLVAFGGPAAIGPLRRMAAFRAENRAPLDMLVELWNRNGFGAAATHLIARFPWSGIGIGSFQNFGPLLTPIGPLPGDNAQNWYRHQVVELGWLGAAGWLWFSAAFGWFVLKPGQTPASATPARSIVIAIGLISLLGMPTQQVTAAIAFWTAAAWYVRRAGLRVEDGPLGWRMWAVVLGVSVAFTASTVHAARTDLRVPNRAREIGWPYAYGFYSPEPDPEGGEQRWMARRAVALVDVHGSVLDVSVRIPHGDIAEHPVDLKVWYEGRTLIDTKVSSPEPVSATVFVGGASKPVLLEARVSRAVRPSEHGAADTRELGALVKWAFRP